jgi:hypothetical protein
MVTIGFGMAVVVSPLTTTVMNSVSETQTGIASGINNSVEEVSSLLAVALFGTVALAIFQQALPGHLSLAGFDPSSDTARAAEAIGNTLAASPIPSFVQGADRAQLEAALNGCVSRRLSRDDARGGGNCPVQRGIRCLDDRPRFRRRRGTGQRCELGFGRKRCLRRRAYAHGPPLAALSKSGGAPLSGNNATIPP